MNIDSTPSPASAAGPPSWRPRSPSPPGSRWPGRSPRRRSSSVPVPPGSWQPLRDPLVPREHPGRPTAATPARSAPRPRPHQVPATNGMNHPSAPRSSTSSRATRSTRPSAAWPAATRSRAGSGDDDIFGGGGNDVLWGEENADELSGRRGHRRHLLGDDPALSSGGFRRKPRHDPGRQRATTPCAGEPATTSSAAARKRLRRRAGWNRHLLDHRDRTVLSERGERLGRSEEIAAARPRAGRARPGPAGRRSGPNAWSGRCRNCRPTETTLTIRFVSRSGGGRPGSPGPRGRCSRPPAPAAAVRTTLSAQSTLVSVAGRPPAMSFIGAAYTLSSWGQTLGTS